jgi:hypothetical protein
MSHVIAPRFIGPALGDGGYQVGYSCRFNDDDTAYLERTTFGTPTSTTAGALSFWLKHGNLGIPDTMIFGANMSGGELYIEFTGDQLHLYQNNGFTTFQYITNALYRDPSAWYHVAVIWDTANGAPSDRFKLYVNGVRITSFSSSTDPALNATLAFSANALKRIGTRTFAVQQMWDGYLSQFALIDGGTYTIDNFGEFDDNGVWQPIDVSGLTFGTNGFLLDFAIDSNLGNDVSGNNNDFTSSGLTTADQMTDTPTVNYCVLNPLDAVYPGQAPRDGNLVYQWTTPNQYGVVGTIAVNAGKFYWETVVTAGVIALCTGVVPQDRPHRNVQYPFTGESGHGGVGNNAVVYLYSGVKEVNGVTTAYGASYAVNDVVGVALDLTAQTITFYKNNVSQGAISLPVSDESWTPCNGGVGDYCTIQANFGQRPFTYTPPTGFKALNTANLAKPTIKDGSDNYQTVLDTGANIKTAAEAVFPSFLEWIKDRVNSNNHQLIDSVRGTSAVIQSNTTAAETTYSAPSGNSVGWIWKANGSGVMNGDGSISSMVSANQAAGFSVVTYTGTGSAATVGHGLGVTPSLIVVKKRDAGGANTSWHVYATPLGASDYIVLNTAAALPGGSQSIWNNTASTASVFSIGTSTWPQVNANGGTYVAYCFAEIPGYSKIGSFDAITSADGTFIYTGFSPAFVLMNKTTAAQNWYITDSARNPYNVADKQLSPNLADAESASAYTDLLSNGFKLRFSDTGTYIFIAFAENPFGGKDTTPMTAR